MSAAVDRDPPCAECGGWWAPERDGFGRWLCVTCFDLGNLRRMFARYPRPS